MPECSIEKEICEGKCTGWNGTLEEKIVIEKGENAWEARRKIVKAIPCDTCNEEANLLETFSHDIVNARIGKPIHDKNNFKKHAEIIQCICDNTGVC